MNMASHAAIYDPLRHTVLDDPFGIYRELREEYPVYRCEERDCWVLSRFDDVQQTARDWKRLSNDDGVELDQPAHFIGIGDFLESDPPRHTRLRKVLHEHFKPKTLATLEPSIRARVERLVEPMFARGHGDIAAELAFPLPIQTTLDMMGFSAEEGELIGRFMAESAVRTPGTDETPAHARNAIDKLGQLAYEAVAERQTAPREDLMTVIGQAEAAGQMDAEDIPGMCGLLLIAGFETTAGLLSSAFFQLAHHPQQRAFLAANPDAIPAAVEEVLRFDSPVQYVTRLAMEDVEFHGTKIPAGETLLLLYGAANHDDRRWDRADSFDVTRELKRNLTFGEGIHHCLGAPLARLEGRIALEVILERAPEYTIVGEHERFHTHVVRGLEHLPISVSASA